MRNRLRGRVGIIAALLLAGTGLAEQGARYLIIAADSYAGIVRPLAEWRTKRGILSKVVTVTEAGGNATAIQSYIRNAYNTWPVRPEFVALAGGPAQVPPASSSSDCGYGDMTGGYQMEISVGRLYATTAQECSLQVNKVLAYEKPDWGGDTLWFIRGTTTVREDNTPADDSIYWTDSRTAHNYWISRNYAVIDSFSANRGQNSSHVNASCADGRAFLTFRGQGVSSWWGFQSITPSTWGNGAEMPITVGATCATMSLTAGESMYGDQFVRAGTPSALGGAIAYFGTTGVTSHGAFYRSAVYQGFFNALFGEKNPWLGPATVRGRFRVDSLYPGVSARYLEWTLFGDPALNVWTAEPRHAGATYDSVVPLAPQNFRVTVTGNGGTVQGAMVCLMMDSTVYVVGATDAQGRVELPINPTRVGTMSLTISAANLIPLERTVRVIVTNEPYLSAESVAVDDYTGNHDRLPNPGERLRVGVGLRNLGAVTATGVTAVLRLAQAGVTLIDSSAGYGIILPDSTVFPGDNFELGLDGSLADGAQVNGTAHVTDDAARSWDCGVSFVVRAGRLELVTATLLDAVPGGNANGRLGRGESGLLQVGVQNSGGGGLSRVRATIACADTTIVITDRDAWYGRLYAGQGADGSADRFAVAAPLSLPRGQATRFNVSIEGDGGTYAYADTFSFSIQGELGVTPEPTGPDSYGYWCYDDTDIESGQAPAYNWLELGSGLGTVIPAVSDSDAATRVLALPFSFRMYGTTSSQLSVNSNGFLALGVTNWRNGTNYPIPNANGPALMMAPFWDDLNPDEGSNGYGTAYEYYDSAAHRYIVEFKDFAHYNQPNIRETFQAILYDPAYYPTPTTDGEIVFMYNRVSLNSSNTVGIENAAQTDGIQYLYNNTYAPTAAYLQANRAIKFTTIPPNTLTRPWLVLDGFEVSDSLFGNGNGVGEPGEVLTVQVRVRNSGAGPAENVQARLRAVDDEGTVQDSSAWLGSIAIGGTAGNESEPFTFRVADVPGDSVAEAGLLLAGDGYATVAYFSFGLEAVTGISGPRQLSVFATGLDHIRPNPVAAAAQVSFSLGRPGSYELALYDAAGRRVATLGRGSAGPGRYEASLPVAALAQGVYFCRLSVQADGRVERFARKLEVVH